MIVPIIQTLMTLVTLFRSFQMYKSIDGCWPFSEGAQKRTICYPPHFQTLDEMKANDRFRDIAVTRKRETVLPLAPHLRSFRGTILNGRKGVIAVMTVKGAEV